MELHFADLKECTLMAKRGKLHLWRVNQILLDKVVIKKGATSGISVALPQSCSLS